MLRDCLFLNAYLTGLPNNKDEEIDYCRLSSHLCHVQVVEWEVWHKNMYTHIDLG